MAMFGFCKGKDVRVWMSNEYVLEVYYGSVHAASIKGKGVYALVCIVGLGVSYGGRWIVLSVSSE